MAMSIKSQSIIKLFKFLREPILIYTYLYVITLIYYINTDCMVPKGFKPMFRLS